MHCSLLAFLRTECTVPFQKMQSLMLHGSTAAQAESKLAKDELSKTETRAKFKSLQSRKQSAECNAQPASIQPNAHEWKQKHCMIANAKESSQQVYCSFGFCNKHSQQATAQDVTI